MASPTVVEVIKRSRFTVEQIVRILSEADKSLVVEVAKPHEVSEPSIDPWRRRFGTLGIDDVKCLKPLDQKNNRFNKRETESEKVE
jgi:putative transposase